MKEFLILLRKIDFSDLYKYGELVINPNFRIEITSKKDIDNCAQELLKKSNPFDYAFSYIFVYALQKEKNYYLKIEEVYSIIPLDKDSKKDFEESFDNFIKIEDPIWENFVKIEQKNKDIKYSKKGVKNLWKIYNFEEKWIDDCSSIITDEIIEELFNILYNSKKLEDATSIWTYLMHYDRHGYYPKDNRGFFIDCVHIFCNFTRKKELLSEDIEQTDIYKQIMNYESFNRFEDIRKLIENTSFEEKIISIYNKDHFDFILVTVLFLYFKHKFNENNVLNEDEILKAKEKFNFSFYLAMYLLGIMLGYSKTYDDLYKKYKLNIYNDTCNLSQVETIKKLKLSKDKYFKILNTSKTDINQLEDVINNGEYTKKEQKKLKEIFFIDKTLFSGNLNSV